MNINNSKGKLNSIYILHSFYIVLLQKHLERNRKFVLPCNYYVMGIIEYVQQVPEAINFSMSASTDRTKASMIRGFPDGAQEQRELAG